MKLDHYEHNAQFRWVPEISERPIVYKNVNRILTDIKKLD